MVSWSQTIAVGPLTRDVRPYKRKDYEKSNFREPLKIHKIGRFTGQVDNCDKKAEYV
jgi:hypothetical protein